MTSRPTVNVMQSQRQLTSISISHLRTCYGLGGSVMKSIYSLQWTYMLADTRGG